MDTALYSDAGLHNMATTTGAVIVIYKNHFEVRVIDLTTIHGSLTWRREIAIYALF